MRFCLDLKGNISDFTFIAEKQRIHIAPEKQA
jgi:hypothetical protein